MGTPTQQQQQLPPAATGLLSTPLIWELTALDLGVLLALGMAVSASAWFVTEGLKVRKVLTGHRAKMWAPFVYCTVMAAVLFPVTLLGVEPNHTMPLWVQLLIAVLALGPVGGFGAKKAHDWGERFMNGLFGWALGKLGSSEAEDEP